MSVTLVVAETRDSLARQVCDHLSNAVRCTGRELFAQSDFRLSLDGTSVDGALTVAGRALPFEQLAGVFFRPVRRWRPPAALRASNRAFVWLETQAAWCALLNALPCPVFNRLAPAWWVDEALYRASLTQSFARELGLGVSPWDDESTDGSTDASGTPPETPISVYAVGKHLVEANPMPPLLKSHLGARAGDIARWQHATGIGLARIDFLQRSGHAVRCVDPLPVMGLVPARLRERLARAVAGAIA